jgi:hypothetical protein
MSTCLCFDQLMLNNVTTCRHPKCQEINNELKTNSAASDFAGLFAKQHLLKIPQTLKCDIPPEEVCNPWDRGKCRCNGGCLRAVERKLAQTHWMKHSVPHTRPKYHGRPSYNLRGLEGQAAMMGDRLLAIQEIADKFTEECECLENPLYEPPKTVQCVILQTPEDPKWEKIRVVYGAYKLGALSHETLVKTVAELYSEDNILVGPVPTFAALQS